MTIQPFQSKQELLKLSRAFVRVLVQNFRKDIRICLTAERDRRNRRRSSRSHAYFPALMTCIGFTDFLSGLYAGKLEGHGLNELKAYAAKFMDQSNYGSLELDILYEMFRHKLAHLGYLPVVFDTATKRKRFSGPPFRRITWGVYARRRQRPIEIEDLTTQRYLPKRKHYPSWDVPYDCIVRISVKHFQTDIIKSIYGQSGYLRALEVDPIMQHSFAACMRVYFPP
jgi:hypothetical protein